MIFKGIISCYSLLSKLSRTFENTKFIAGELSLIVSLVRYLSADIMNADKRKGKQNRIKQYNIK